MLRVSIGIFQRIAILLSLMMTGCDTSSLTPQAKTARVPGAGVPVAAPAPVATISAAAPLPDYIPPELYSDHTGGEEFAPSTAAASTPLRARKGDTIFKLSNARFEPVGKKPFPFMAVDYELVGEGVYHGQALNVRDARGHDQTVLLAGPFDRAGTIEVDLGFGIPGDGGPTKNAEFFMTRQEPRYGGGFAPTFKVSNSTIMGTTKLPMTLARNWTADEAAKLKQPPPEAPKPNTHPEAGEDSNFVGDENGGAFRYAEAGKPVLGVEFRAGEWDNEQCLARLIPVYEAKQPPEAVTKRVMAKVGYAVGGLTVRSKTFVNAVRVVFMKLTPEGKLDTNDKYTSDWLGPMVEGANEVEIAGDGRRVIGINCHQGAILNAVALVVEPN